MKQTNFEIKDNKALTDLVYEMKLKGDVSSITAPGQFVNIQIEGLYLRRPISVCDINDDELTLVYKVVGKGTEEMSKMLPGKMLDVLTGLGNGYDLSESGMTPLLIGGGVGIPPLYLLARKLKDQGKDVRVILGFNTASEIFYKKEFEDLLKDKERTASKDSTQEAAKETVQEAAQEATKKVIITTVDGSEGVKGFVTDGIALSESGFSYVYTCGPEPMLKAVYKEVSTGAQFSFEERMGCGFGVCMGCTCKTISGYKRICKDGPVLKKTEIVW